MIFKKLLADLRVLLGQATPAASSKNDVDGKAPAATTLERETSNASTTVNSSSSSSAEPSPRHADDASKKLQIVAEHQDQHDDQESHTEGLEQSPIDICALDSELVLQDDEEIQVVLSDATHVRIVHSGANFRVDWMHDNENDQAKRSCIKIQGKTYYAVQFHFHAPSTS